MKKLTVTVAPGTTEETCAYIADGFRRIVGECDAEFITDESVIGGFTAACDGRFWDMSIRTQLRRLAEHMEGEDEA